MALTADEQAALDRIKAELTRTDPYLAIALVSFAAPPGRDPMVETMRARLRSPWTVISVLGVFVALVLAVVGTQTASGRCADSSAHPVCVELQRTSAATQGAVPAEQ